MRRPMTSLRSHAIFLSALAGVALAASACKGERPQVQTTSAAQDLDPKTVVAEVGGKKITAGDLQTETSAGLASLEPKYQRDKYELRRDALLGQINDQLVKAAAAKAGMGDQQWVMSELDKRIKPPSDEEKRKFYDAQLKQVPPGTQVPPYEAVEPRIAQMLMGQQRQQKAQELLAELRKQNNVKIFLSPPRVAVEAKGPSKGPENAKVTIVEFSDFECPYCQRAEGTISQVMDTYAGKVRLVFRYFPLSFHAHAQKAAEAAACANDQGKFWEMHQILFQNQQALEVDKLKEYAKSIGLDTAKFDKCLDSGEKAGLVKADMEAGQKVGVNGTPAFFINGVSLSGAQPFDQFKQVIDEELESH